MNIDNINFNGQPFPPDFILGRPTTINLDVVGTKQDSSDTIALTATLEVNGEQIQLLSPALVNSTDNLLASPDIVKVGEITVNGARSEEVAFDIQVESGENIYDSQLISIEHMDSYEMQVTRKSGDSVQISPCPPICKNWGKVKTSATVGDLVISLEEVLYEVQDGEYVRINNRNYIVIASAHVVDDDWNVQVSPAIEQSLDVGDFVDTLYYAETLEVYARAQSFTRNYNLFPSDPIGFFDLDNLNYSDEITIKLKFTHLPTGEISEHEYNIEFLEPEVMQISVLQYPDRKQGGKSYKLQVTLGAPILRGETNNMVLALLDVSNVNKRIYNAAGSQYLKGSCEFLPYKKSKVLNES